MQSTPVSSRPWHLSYYPIPRNCRFRFSHLPHNHNKPFTVSSHSATHNQTQFATPTNSYCKEGEGQKTKRNPTYPDHKNLFLGEEFRSSIESEDTQFKQGGESELTTGLGISTTMWWADFKAALGQSINLEGIASSMGIFARDKHLAIPHVSVPDIRYIDWIELKKRGFRGVVFDKDNTITVPYSLSLYTPLRSSVEQCKSLFGDNVAVFSNSAGLYEYDPDGRKARALERKIGIKVLRHKVKKPAGTAEEIENHFGCETSRLIMVGDRPFTDIVYGNRNGFLTILTDPLSLVEEPFIVKQVRVLELAFTRYWSSQGLKPITHGLLPDPQQCVKDTPL